MGRGKLGRPKLDDKLFKISVESRNRKEIHVLGIHPVVLSPSISIPLPCPSRLKPDNNSWLGIGIQRTTYEHRFTHLSFTIQGETKAGPSGKRNPYCEPRKKIYLDLPECPP